MGLVSLPVQVLRLSRGQPKQPQVSARTEQAPLPVREQLTKEKYKSLRQGMVVKYTIVK